MTVGVPVEVDSVMVSLEDFLPSALISGDLIVDASLALVRADVG